MHREGFTHYGVSGGIIYDSLGEMRYSYILLYTKGDTDVSSIFLSDDNL